MRRSGVDCSKFLGGGGWGVGGLHLYFTLQTRLKSAQSRSLASSRQHIPPITTLFFLKLLKMAALVELPLFLSPSRPLSPPPPGSNQVEAGGTA